MGITKFELFVAQGNISHYSALIVAYESMVNENKIKLKKIKTKIQNNSADKKTGFMKILQNIELFMPVVGLEVQKNKLEAFVNVYSKSIIEWTEELNNSKIIAQKYQEEHSPDWKKFWEKERRFK